MGRRGPKPGGSNDAQRAAHATRLRVFAELQARDGTVTGRALAEDVGAPISTIHNWLNRAEDRGEVAKSPCGRHGHYVLPMASNGKVA